MIPAIPYRPTITSNPGEKNWENLSWEPWPMKHHTSPHPLLPQEFNPQAFNASGRFNNVKIIYCSLLNIFENVRQARFWAS